MGRGFSVLEVLDAVDRVTISPLAAKCSRCYSADRLYLKRQRGSALLPGAAHIECANVRSGTNAVMSSSNPTSGPSASAGRMMPNSTGLVKLAFEKHYGIGLAGLAEEFARRSLHRTKLLNMMGGEVPTETRPRRSGEV
jgi:hypothetical protein